jgi:hypothetical protein
MTNTLLLAYLDPVSGGFILYVIVGLFASAWVVLKKWGHQIKAMITGKPIEEEAEDEAPAAEDAPAEEASATPAAEDARPVEAAPQPESAGEERA